MNELEKRIQDHYTDAMRAGDKLRKDTLRLMRAALKSAQIDKRAPLSDEEVIDVLSRQAKQRRESIEQFLMGNRQDLAEIEQAELAVIEGYLPQQLSRDEITALAKDVIAELGVTDPGAIGQVMGRLMPLVKGKADGRLVNQVVRELLSG